MAGIIDTNMNLNVPINNNISFNNVNDFINSDFAKNLQLVYGLDADVFHNIIMDLFNYLSAESKVFKNNGGEEVSLFAERFDIKENTLLNSGKEPDNIKKEIKDDIIQYIALFNYKSIENVEPSKLDFSGWKELALMKSSQKIHQVVNFSGFQASYTNIVDKENSKESSDAERMYVVSQGIDNEKREVIDLTVQDREKSFNGEIRVNARKDTDNDKGKIAELDIEDSGKRPDVTEKVSVNKSPDNNKEKVVNLPINVISEKESEKSKNGDLFSSLNSFFKGDNDKNTIHISNLDFSLKNKKDETGDRKVYIEGLLNNSNQIIKSDNNIVMSSDLNNRAGIIDNVVNIVNNSIGELAKGNHNEANIKVHLSSSDVISINVKLNQNTVNINIDTNNTSIGHFITSNIDVLRNNLYMHSFSLGTVSVNVGGGFTNTNGEQKKYGQVEFDGYVYTGQKRNNAINVPKVRSLEIVV